MPEQDPLAQLRDIHLPDAISTWPPAPGWWIASTLLIALIIGLIYLLIKWIRRNRYRKLALLQLNKLDQENANQYVQQLNQLLKQTALAAQPKQEIAGLCGEPWLQFLDNSGDTQLFCNGVGKILADGPYSPTVENINTKKLNEIAQQWIKNHDVARSGS
jgi:hypothetical protein